MAVDAGVMFDSLRTEDHDGWIAAARAAVTPVSALEVGEAFLASLTSRRLDLRSALGSYAVARFLPEHPFESVGPGFQCQVCDQYEDSDGEDLNVLNFERFKWGGVRTDCVEYLAFDLEQFALAPRLRPTRADIELGQRLIDQLRQLPPETTAARAVTQLKMINGNKAERDKLIGILGVCGILGTADHPGYATAFVRSADRVLPERRFVDQSYPACWWTAADGVNAEALNAFLPQLS
ncbi:MAG TPA: hypothetical protein VFI65_24115 [Streptosporangiaceae bacterium]|nr:hypothetical protein [Streptosporangiaceae bacterium]